jgi:hypothetical protein
MQQPPYRGLAGGGILDLVVRALRLRVLVAQLLGVALQVAFERQTLKPAFSLDRL